MPADPPRGYAHWVEAGFARSMIWHPTTVCPRCHAGWPNGPERCPSCGKETLERGGYFVTSLVRRRGDG